MADNQSTKCQFCKRKLTDTESIALGAGPECRAKLQSQMASVDAGRAIEKSLGDYKLTTLGARLTTLGRIEARFVGDRAAVPASLQTDLQTARANYARRVEYLASQGYLTIPEIPAPAPAMAQDEAGGVAPAPPAYEIACMAVVAAEERYQREYSNPNSVNFTDAILALQNAKIARAQAARDEIKARVYPVRRTAVADSATVLMPAGDALARIADEWIASIHDSAEDDAALRAGLPVRTLEATYHAVL